MGVAYLYKYLQMMWFWYLRIKSSGVGTLHYLVQLALKCLLLNMKNNYNTEML